MTTEVWYRATQRAGLRGFGFELGLFVVYVVLAPVFSRTTGGVAMWVAAAACGVLFRLALFSGPHRRGVEVTDRVVRFGRSTLPLADVERVEVVDRRELRRRADELAMEHVPPGPVEGVILHLVSPEGIEYGLGLAVDGAAGLADHIEQVRGRAPRPTAGLPTRPAPVVARQGVDLRWSALPVGVGVVLDVLSLTVGDGVVVGMTLLGVAMVVWTATRQVRVDASGITTRGIRLPRDQIRSVRLATFGEQLQLPKGRSRAPIWGPPYALVIIVDGPTGSSVRRRTVVIGVPEPIDAEVARP